MILHLPPSQRRFARHSSSPRTKFSSRGIPASFTPHLPAQSPVFQACGPNRVMSSDFEHALFSSQYPTIVTQCMLKGERCFLSDPQWKNIMGSPNLHDSPL